MSEHEIISPPWPGEGTTTELLYQRLLELRDWVANYRDDLNEKAGQDVIPALRKPPKREVYMMQPVMAQFQHFSVLQKIRGMWDALVREYEEEWDSKFCVRQQLMLVQTAAITFNDAFTPFEVQEARSQKQQERMQRKFEKLREYMESLLGEPDDKHEPPEVD